MIKQFGGKVTSKLESRYSQSPNWDGSKFVNLVETRMEFSLHELPKMLYEQFFKTKHREPKEKLPIIPFDKENFLAPSETAKFIWYGHSVVLMRLAGKTILIDPMLGPDAAPIAPVTTSRYSENTLELIDDFPQIDLLIMTHDHYDHLDMASIKRLMPKVSQYFVALGVGRHLVEWGIEESVITEFDWWDDHSLEDIQITYTPTRHFSGRGLTDRAKSLWGGWAFHTENEKIYFSGDGGYGDHFKEVGEKLGPFDFGIMECGQYNQNWHQIHMYPEESVQASIDAGAGKIMPVHWAGFSLAQHTWTDPVERFTAEAKNKERAYMTPRLGEIFSYDDDKQEAWWEGH